MSYHNGCSSRCKSKVMFSSPPVPKNDICQGFSQGVNGKRAHCVYTHVILSTQKRAFTANEHTLDKPIVLRVQLNVNSR